MGCTLVIINGFDPKTFLGVIEKYKINSIVLSAAAFFNLITYPDSETLIFDIRSVKLVSPK